MGPSMAALRAVLGLVAGPLVYLTGRRVIYRYRRQCTIGIVGHLPLLCGSGLMIILLLEEVVSHRLTFTMILAAVRPMMFITLLIVLLRIQALYFLRWMA